MTVTREELEAFIKTDAARIVEELGFDWNELPGEIAWSAVVDLVIEADTILPEGRQTTLAEIGRILEVTDEA